MASEFEVPLEESVRLLRQVLPQMSRLQIPTIPQNYAVWYDYVANRTPGLRREVERLLSAGSQFDPTECKRIWEEFYLDPARREVDGLRESMRDAVETVMKELGDLGTDIVQYSDACLYRSKERGRNRVTGERDLELVVNDRAS